VIPGAALALLALGCPEPARRPPDVILITLDTTRLDRLGAFGGAPETTPNLDELAAEGVRFERAWTTAPWTLPSHA
jgi:arylsulfatase A-like enzyme